MHVCSCDVLCEIGLKVEWGNLKHANIQSRKLETLRHPKIEPHCLQMNLKYQIWTCVKLLRWNKTLIWPWESRAHSPANRFWPWVRSKFEMKLILNWESFDTQFNKNWIWSECDLKKWSWFWTGRLLTLNWIRIEFEVNVIWNLNWIWNDCELNLKWIWIWNDCELNWVWIELEFEFEPRATTSTSWQQNAVWHPYRLSKSLQQKNWKDW